MSESMAGILILFNPFLGILLVNTNFSFLNYLHMFVHSFDTLEIPLHCPGNRDTLKKVIWLFLSQAVSLL